VHLQPSWNVIWQILSFTQALAVCCEASCRSSADNAFTELNGKPSPWRRGEKHGDTANRREATWSNCLHGLKLLYGNISIAYDFPNRHALPAKMPVSAWSTCASAIAQYILQCRACSCYSDVSCLPQI
jgi:hypothetical protein